MWNPFKKEAPAIKDLGFLVAKNEERRLTREFEKHSVLFNRIIGDICNAINEGYNHVNYPYEESMLLAINACRSNFREWGKRHNLNIYIGVHNTGNVESNHIIFTLSAIL